PRIPSSACPAPQTPPPAAASSTSRNVTRATRAPGKTPPHSARSALARKSTSSTSVVLACFVPAASSRLPPFPQATMLHPPLAGKMRFTYRSHNSRPIHLHIEDGNRLTGHGGEGQLQSLLALLLLTLGD